MLCSPPNAVYTTQLAPGHLANHPVDHAQEEAPLVGSSAPLPAPAPEDDPAHQPAQVKQGDLPVGPAPAAQEEPEHSNPEAGEDVPPNPTLAGEDQPSHRAQGPVVPPLPDMPGPLSSASEEEVGPISLSILNQPAPAASTLLWPLSSYDGLRAAHVFDDRAARSQEHVHVLADCHLCLYTYRTSVRTRVYQHSMLCCMI
jgi:hypothetical protein